MGGYGKEGRSEAYATVSYFTSTEPNQTKQQKDDLEVGGLQRYLGSMSFNWPDPWLGCLNLSHFRIFMKKISKLFSVLYEQ